MAAAASKADSHVLAVQNKHWDGTAQHIDCPLFCCIRGRFGSEVSCAPVRLAIMPGRTQLLPCVLAMLTSSSCTVNEV